MTILDPHAFNLLKLLFQSADGAGLLLASPCTTGPAGPITLTWLRVVIPQGSLCKIVVQTFLGLPLQENMP